ncbi:AMP-binding protein, partial [Spinactinospora alkalitolerans]
MPQSRSTPVSRAPQLSGLGELVYHNAHEAPQAPLFSRKADGQWHHVNATEFLRDVTAVAKGLIAAGVGAGDRVVLGCATGYEWTLVNFAIWAVRGVVVPVHPACSRRRLHHILRDCRPAAAVVESDRHAAAIAEIQHELLDLGRTWRLADDSGLEAVTKPGAYIDGSAVRLRRDETTRADPAAISYPVTTAPDAPGSVLTHGNFLAGAESLIQRLSPLLAGGEQASTLMHLPLADVFGHSALVGCVMARVRVGFCERGAQVRREVRMFRPTVLLALPRLLEQVYAVEKAKAKESGWDNLNAFNAATELAVDFDKSGRRGAWRRVSRVMYEWMYSRIKEALGGRVRFIVVGGGQLPARLTHFYGGAGLPVLQGFGTVQTTGAFVLNAPGEVRVGTVGRPVPGVEVRLSREAEVLVRGATVFAGHHGRAAGAGPGRDGWLATGVFGRLDSEGYLVVDERPSRPRPRPEVDAGPGPGAGEAGRGPA